MKMLAYILSIGLGTVAYAAVENCEIKVELVNYMQFNENRVYCVQELGYCHTGTAHLKIITKAGQAKHIWLYADYFDPEKVAAIASLAMAKQNNLAVKLRLNRNDKDCAGTPLLQSEISSFDIDLSSI